MLLSPKRKNWPTRWQRTYRYISVARICYETKTRRECFSRRALIDPTKLCPPLTIALKHQLHAPDDFIELILAQVRIGLAEIRPGMYVIHHQFEIVAADVVIEAANN